MDSNGSVYVCKTCTVTATGNGMQKVVPLDQVGMFRFELPAGIYNLTTDIPRAYPVRRAPVQLKVGETAIVILVPLVRVVSIGTEYTEHGDRTFREIAKQPSMEQLEVGSQSQLPAVIEFESKKTRANEIIYADPILSYGALTIYADTLTYDKLSRRFRASGQKVIVDYGGARKTGTQVEGKLDPQSLCFTIK